MRFDARRRAALLVTALVACAEGNVQVEPSATTTASTGGAAAGGGPGAGSCERDCTSVETPQCLKSVCNEGQYEGVVGECAIVPDPGATCDDGAFCTIEDSCDEAGTCVGGRQNDCGMTPSACNESSCNETTKSCSETPAANGTACTHSDLCMVNTTCTNGVCQGIPMDCFFAPVPNDCHVAACNPATGLCEPQIGNEGAPCVDPAALCTTGKTCSMGTCIGGGPKDCSSLTQGCFNGVCDPATGVCAQQPVMVGDPCLDATDDCNNGICDMNGMCQPVPTNQGGTCEDGNPCTAGETCNNGQCAGGTIINQVVHFNEDFSDNSAGWLLDTEWQIGPTSVSSGEDWGFPDPATDHTSATNDNGVAGVVLGGNAAQNLHPYYYLTSPPINVASVNGPLWLGFYRWLNSDYLPFMQNVVEVFDGTNWIKLWEEGQFPGVTDSAWTQMAFDIAAYKNNALKVRFGFEIGSTGVFAVSQWNVDDVVIANVVCP